MKIALVHNYYQQPGGEDEVFADEGALLEAHGHRVVRYTAHNERIAGMRALGLAQVTVWNRASYRELRAFIRNERPAVVHFQNTFPLISPAAYYAARAEGVPVVQTLHNYRLLCPNALFFRDGHVCEDCLGKSIPWPGVAHACYRGSRMASGAVASMLSVHRALRTWTKMIDVYIVLNEFARQKFIEGGLPSEKVVVKPNFIYPDPGPGEGRGGYALFVGRLSVEKGLQTLLAAWKQFEEQPLLRIVGDGPLADQVDRAARKLTNVEWLGKQPGEKVLALMKDAQVLLLPSVWYEGFPLVIVEAYAVGLPVIASDLGAMSSLIDHGRTGLLFRPGDSQDLAAHVEQALRCPSSLAQMRREVRAEFENNYAAERNYQSLMSIYDRATELARKG